MWKRHAYALAGPLLVLVISMLPLRDGFTDDGFIHIQYAQNLITRGEYSFNPGEVSFGTSSPLWVIELAAIGRVFSDGEALIAVSRILSWLSGLAAIGCVYALSLLLGLRRKTAILAALTFATDVWFVRWTALSMETSMAVLAVLLMGIASVRALDDRRYAGLLGVFIALASLVRPEVYLAFPVYLLAVATRWRTCDRRAVFTTLAVAALLLTPWLLFARFHIGSFLPNTAGAKSGGMVLSPLEIYHRFGPVVKILGSSGGIVMLAGFVSVMIMRGRSRLFSANSRFLLLWAICLPCAYVTLGIQILSRYLLLASPIILVLSWSAIEQLSDERFSSRARRVALPVVAGLAIVTNLVFYAFVVVPPSRAFTYDLTHEMKSIALYLDENAAPDAVVAAADIGYLAFYSKRRVLDLGGLVEPETGVLRERYSYEEIIQRGLYFDVPGYPHVDYFIDRDLVPSRFDGTVLAGHRFEQVYARTVRNLGIRKPGPYYYVLYRLTPVSE